MEGVFGKQSEKLQGGYRVPEVENTTLLLSVEMYLSQQQW
jgi:hypothetical protein